MKRIAEIKSYTNIYIYLIQINTFLQRAQETIIPQSTNPAMLPCLVKAVF